MRAHPRCRRSRSSPTPTAPPRSASTPSPRRPAPRGRARPRTRRARRPARPGRDLRRRRCDRARAARHLPEGCGPVVGWSSTASRSRPRPCWPRRTPSTAASSPASRSSTQHPSARFTGWTPARAVTQWAWTRTAHDGPLRRRRTGAADLLTLRAAALLSAAEVVLYPGTYLDEGFLVDVSPGRRARRHPGPRPRPDHGPPHRGFPGGVRGGAAGLGRPLVYSALTEQTHRLDPGRSRVGRDTRRPGVRRCGCARRSRADHPAGGPVRRTHPGAGALHRDAGGRGAGQLRERPAPRSSYTWPSRGPAS